MKRRYCFTPSEITSIFKKYKHDNDKENQDQYLLSKIDHLFATISDFKNFQINSKDIDYKIIIESFCSLFMTVLRINQCSKYDVIRYTSLFSDSIQKILADDMVDMKNSTSDSIAQFDKMFDISFGFDDITIYPDIFDGEYVDEMKFNIVDKVDHPILQKNILHIINSFITNISRGLFERKGRNDDIQFNHNIHIILNQTENIMDIIICGDSIDDNTSKKFFSLVSDLVLSSIKINIIPGNAFHQELVLFYENNDLRLIRLFEKAYIDVDDTEIMSVFDLDIKLFEKLILIFYKKIESNEKIYINSLSRCINKVIRKKMQYNPEVFIPFCDIYLKLFYRIATITQNDIISGNDLCFIDIMKEFMIEYINHIYPKRYELDIDIMRETESFLCKFLTQNLFNNALNNENQFMIDYFLKAYLTKSKFTLEIQNYYIVQKNIIDLVTRFCNNTDLHLSQIIFSVLGDISVKMRKQLQNKIFDILFNKISMGNTHIASPLESSSLSCLSNERGETAFYFACLFHILNAKNFFNKNEKRFSQLIDHLVSKQNSMELSIFYYYLIKNEFTTEDNPKWNKFILNVFDKNENAKNLTKIVTDIIQSEFNNNMSNCNNIFIPYLFFLHQVSHSISYVFGEKIGYYDEETIRNIFNMMFKHTNYKMTDYLIKHIRYIESHNQEYSPYIWEYLPRIIQRINSTDDSYYLIDNAIISFVGYLEENLFEFGESVEEIIRIELFVKNIIIRANILMNDNNFLSDVMITNIFTKLDTFKHIMKVIIHIFYSDDKVSLKKIIFDGICKESLINILGCRYLSKYALKILCKISFDDSDSVLNYAKNPRQLFSNLTKHLGLNGDVIGVKFNHTPQMYIQSVNLLIEDIDLHKPSHMNYIYFAEFINKYGKKILNNVLGYSILSPSILVNTLINVLMRMEYINLTDPNNIRIINNLLNFIRQREETDNLFVKYGLNSIIYGLGLSELFSSTQESIFLSTSLFTKINIITNTCNKDYYPNHVFWGRYFVSNCYSFTRFTDFFLKFLEDDLISSEIFANEENIIKIMGGEFFYKHINFNIYQFFLFWGDIMKLKSVCNIINNLILSDKCSPSIFLLKIILALTSSSGYHINAEEIKSITNSYILKIMSTSSTELSDNFFIKMINYSSEILFTISKESKIEFPTICNTNFEFQKIDHSDNNIILNFIDGSLEINKIILATESRIAINLIMSSTNCGPCRKCNNCIFLAHHIYISDFLLTYNMICSNSSTINNPIDLIKIYNVSVLMGFDRIIRICASKIFSDFLDPESIEKIIETHFQPSESFNKADIFQLVTIKYLIKYSVKYTYLNKYILKLKKYILEYISS